MEIGVVLVSYFAWIHSRTNLNLIEDRNVWTSCYACMNQQKPTNRPNVIQLKFGGLLLWTLNTHRHIHLFLICNHTEFPVKFGVSELEHEWGSRLDLRNCADKPNGVTNRSRICFDSTTIKYRGYFLFVLWNRKMNSSSIWTTRDSSMNQQN